MGQFEGGVHKLQMDDPEKSWAIPTAQSVIKTVDEHGMETT